MTQKLNLLSFRVLDQKTGQKFLDPFLVIPKPCATRFEI